MITFNLKWIKNKNQYAYGELLYLNRICVGQYEWNLGQSRDNHDNNKDWIGSINLPSTKKEYTYSDSPNVIKIQIEKMVHDWFDEALKDSETN